MTPQIVPKSNAGKIHQCILSLLGNSRNYREENFVNKSHALEGVRYVPPEPNTVCENTSEGGFVT